MRLNSKIEAIKKYLMVFKNHDNYIKVLALIGLIVLNLLFGASMEMKVWQAFPNPMSLKLLYVVIGLISGMLFKWK